MDEDKARAYISRMEREGVFMRIAGVENDCNVNPNLLDTARLIRRKSVM